MKNLTKLLCGLVSLILIVNYSYGQNQDYILRLPMQDNQVAGNQKCKDASFYCNPLMLNGQSVNYCDFTIKSKGQLSLVKGNPTCATATRVPFYISIRRKGKIIKEAKMEFLNRQVYSIEISTILCFSKSGDELIITPVAKDDWKALRIFKITG